MNNPSYYAKTYPWDSISHKAEHEIVALNIMKILKRTGDIFRELTFDEYKIEREKDGNFSGMEKMYFDEVIEFCKNSDTAKLFSKDWK